MAEVPPALRTSLAKRYHIEREIGAGGTATVFVAEDLKHHRKVALKVFRPDLGASLGPDRFLREVAIAANLQHPHILPLYDSGQVEGLLYYVMPFVEGPSLRQKLMREGELSIPGAVRILRDVADAMAYAHRSGVVHRDLKPENVMLSDRHAMVTDFGVAKALTAAAEQAQGTTAGVALGTPTYMAPEQGTADPHMDHRADIYAFGVMAYELLTGRTPFTEVSPQAMLAAHLTAAVEPVSNRRASIPPVLAMIVMKCLEKKPADRYQTADALLTELESLSTPSGGTTPAVARNSGRRGPVWRALAGTSLVAVLAAAAWFVAGRTGNGDPVGALDGTVLADTASIAVLECQSSAGGQADDFLTEGFTQHIISRLAQVGDLVVINASSVLPLSGSGLSTTQVADTLRVRYVFTCTVTQTDDRVRVFGQLVDARTNAVKWANPIERSQAAENEISDEISQQVASALAGPVGTLRSTPAGSRTAVPGAVQAYLEGNYQLHKRNPAALRAAVDAYSRVIALDSGYAPAHAALASAYGLSLTYMADLGLDPYQAYGEALRLATRAIALDSTLAEGYAIRGYIMTKAFGPADQIIADFGNALRFGPNSADVHGWFAHFRHREGDHEDGLAQAERAITLDPIAPGRRVGYALDAIVAGRYDRAATEADHALGLEPGLGSARRYRAIAALLGGDPHRCLEVGAPRPVVALCLHSVGDGAAAQAIADSVESAYGTGAAGAEPVLADALRARDLACYYGWTGDAAKASTWVERAFAASPYGVDFRVLRSRLFEPVADDTHFNSVMARIQADVWRRTKAEWDRATERSFRS